MNLVCKEYVATRVDNTGALVLSEFAGAAETMGDCLLYTSDAADERSSVDLGGRRIIKKKKSRGNRRARMRRKQKMM